MLFNSAIFIFCFLPIAFLLHWSVLPAFRNVVLFLLSLLFYWWGASSVIGIIIVSIGLNWIVGLIVGLFPGRYLRLTALVLGVIINLGILGYYKYFTFFFKTILGYPPPIEPDAIIPLGISFYTFHSISYLVDLYRLRKPPLLNPINFGLYIALFPQLVAGPIVRFHDIADQIVQRSLRWELLESGLQRFIFGLAKKIILADNLGGVADHIFALPTSDLSTANAWLGALCFALQIYYDFSGYSDMAIGLARLFGFELLENFNYPYLADSITDFWHRWHLSLSAWFQEYLYIPLGGNRGSTFMTYRNLLTVFLLCGLWHGASWNFLIWGAYNGFFLIMERRVNLTRILPAWARHSYALLVIILGWVIFRTTDCHQMVHYVCCLVGFGSTSPYDDALGLLLTPMFAVIFGISIFLAFPLFTCLASDFQTRRFPNKATHLTRLPERFINTLKAHRVSLSLMRSLVCLCLLILSISEIAVGTVHSFIYFHF